MSDDERNEPEEATASDEPDASNDEANASNDEPDASEDVRTWTVEIRVPEDADLEQAGETHEIEVDSDEYVLGRARAEDVWLSADCQQGWCTTCAARLHSGEVDQSDSTRYYDEDREAGFVLPCTAKPRSDLVIEVERHREMLEHRASHDLPPGNSKIGD